VDGDALDLEFSGEIWYWRGPAPWYFVTVPDDASTAVHALSSAVTYGWGMIPVAVTIGDTTMTTALWPKEGTYYVPLKDRLRDAEGIGLGDVVTVRLRIDV
jgi:hypothetical protein